MASSGRARESLSAQGQAMVLATGQLVRQIVQDSNHQVPPLAVDAEARAQLVVRAHNAMLTQGPAIANTEQVPQDRLPAAAGPQAVSEFGLLAAELGERCVPGGRWAADRGLAWQAAPC